MYFIQPFNSKVDYVRHSISFINILFNFLLMHEERAMKKLFKIPPSIQVTLN